MKVNEIHEAIANPAVQSIVVKNSIMQILLNKTEESEMVLNLENKSTELDFENVFIEIIWDTVEDFYIEDDTMLVIQLDS